MTRPGAGKTEATKAGAFARMANRRARLYGVSGVLTRHDLPAGPCHYCGGEADSWDHVVPLRKGGPNEPSNLVRCCVPCNARKGVGGPEDALEPLEYVVSCGACGKSMTRHRTDVRRRSVFYCEDHARRRHGEAHPQARMTEDTVREARRRVSGGESRASVAASLGVGSTTIDRVIGGRTWKHVL
jgi:hypothetical protein